MTPRKSISSKYDFLVQHKEAIIGLQKEGWSKLRVAALYKVPGSAIYKLFALIEGRCERCKSRAEVGSLCKKHRIESRAKARDRYGCNPWEPGSTGRRPIGHEEIPTLSKQLIQEEGECCACGDPACRVSYGYCHCGCGGKTKAAPQSATKQGYIKGRPRRFIWGHKKKLYASIAEERAAQRERSRRRYQETREARLSEDKTRYLALREMILEQRRQQKRWLIPETRKKDQKRKNKRNKERRDFVLNYYGNKCVCCGESETKFLEIDHIHSDGATHRSMIGRGGNAIVNWLISNKFPPGFQILCSNCNDGKNRCGGICPHKLRDLGCYGNNELLPWPVQ